MDTVTIVGAGLAGATAAALLKDRYNVVVLERARRAGGLCKDETGWQECGPHAFHTDDEEVWEFVQRFATWHRFDLQVHVQTDPGLRELPFRPSTDPAFVVYSEKAWGMRWELLPDGIRSRVPTQCVDGRTGYHAGSHKAQPEGGYSAMILRMLRGAKVVRKKTIEGVAEFDGKPVVWTGDLNDAAQPEERLRWLTRTWVQASHAALRAPGHIVNHATHHVPQLRTWDNEAINPWHRGTGVGVEFPGGPGCRPCYPHPEDAGKARAHIEGLRRCNVWCCGRMGAYQYLDMDATIKNVMETIREAGL